MDTKEKILEHIRTNGPSLPTTLAKKLQDNSFFISAHLSEMKDMGKIKISNLKIGGGSPLYYIPGQENQLDRFSDNLGEKERKVYNLLKEKKVVRDSTLVPVFRAAIRSIKDFAAPLTVSFNNEKVLFWKISLLPNKDAENIIKNILGIKEKNKVEPKRGPKKEEPKELKRELKVEEKKVERVETKIEPKPESKVESTKPQPEQQKKLEPAQEQPKEEVKEKPKQESDFHEEVKRYFTSNNIKILEENIIRKTEADYVVELPSPVGSLKYFVKAKSKKKLNDGDLSSVFVQSQTKRLPALFIAKGDLTKKAEEMLESEFKGMKFKNI